MIGNDIVDRRKAQLDSDIFRPRYLDKVLTTEEKTMLMESSDPEQMFWRFWTMKESAYKAFQRQYQFKTSFNPFAFNCMLQNETHGSVVFKGERISIKTGISTDYIYGSTLNALADRNMIRASKEKLNLALKDEFESDFEWIKDHNRFPFLKIDHQLIPISLTHHGGYIGILF